MYLSLASSDTFDKVPLYNIPFLDKIVHFGMYLGLMSAIIFENRKTLRNPTSLFLLAIIPFSYGILMEILQEILTSTRSGSFYDIVFNTFGILVSLIIWFWVNPFKKEI
jgi:VanZ family protein